MSLKRPILTLAFASLFFSATLIAGIVGNRNLQAALFMAEPEVLTVKSFDYEPNRLSKTGEWSFCQYDAPEEGEYGVELLSLSMDESITGGDVFMVDMIFENTGDTRIFASDSACDEAPAFFVGTRRDKNRDSLFGDEDHAISGWESASRIKMQAPYTDPGESFHVIFQSLAPEGDDIYREFLRPLVETSTEDTEWLGETFAMDVEIGTPTESMLDNIQFVLSTSLNAGQLEGLERNLESVLSEQMMYARFGEIRVWGMQMSSGHWQTPTPPGTYSILNKQELRIGGAWPHYRMPYWQGFRIDGYGIHALPYLETDGGYFWEEALDNIGIPVSHGCLRTLPEDSYTLYLFTDIGTTLWVH